mmetsp:Transcript_12622/g.26353  ORF Transcript_12622/g.26353 Transcript_12622/m.26353 type:complete len:176 (-) Transcript_12622:62-589(-)
MQRDNVRSKMVRTTSLMRTNRTSNRKAMVVRDNSCSHKTCRDDELKATRREHSLDALIGIEISLKALGHKPSLQERFDESLSALCLGSKSNASFQNHPFDESWNNSMNSSFSIKSAELQRALYRDMKVRAINNNCSDTKLVVNPGQDRWLANSRSEKTCSAMFQPTRQSSRDELF